MRSLLFVYEAKVHFRGWWGDEWGGKGDVVCGFGINLKSKGIFGDGD